MKNALRQGFMSEFYLDRPFAYRENTSDQIVIEEVYINNCYQFPGCTGVVVDIGANIGAFTCLAAKTATMVYAFEPEPHNFELLKQNTANLPNVTLFNKGVGIPGKNQIQDLQGGSHLSLTGHDLDSATEVEVVSINTICPGVIDFLKVDCEGSEYDIFDNAHDSFLERVEQVAIEFHPWSQERHTATFARLMDFFDFTVDSHGLWLGKQK